MTGFGSNIAGAILGRLCESLSLIIGFNYSLAFAILRYLLAAVSRLRSQKPMGLWYTPRTSVGASTVSLEGATQTSDRRVLRDRGDTFEGELRYSPGGQAGVIRILSFLNHTNSGRYAEAIQLGNHSGGAPDVTAKQTNPPATIPRRNGSAVLR